VNPEEAALARQALRSAEGCARRLARSQGKLAAQFPLSPARVTALPPDVEDDLDAFLKRYEQLVNTIQDELFKVVAIVGGEDVRGLARREMAELMDRLGALPSAASFRLLVAIRNRIAHSYPDDPEPCPTFLLPTRASVATSSPACPEADGEHREHRLRSGRPSAPGTSSPAR